MLRELSLIFFCQSKIHIGGKYDTAENCRQNFIEFNSNHWGPFHCYKVDESSNFFCFYQNHFSPLLFWFCLFFFFTEKRLERERKWKLGRCAEIFDAVNPQRGITSRCVFFKYSTKNIIDISIVDVDFKVEEESYLKAFIALFTRIRTSCFTNLYLFLNEEEWLEL